MKTVSFKVEKIDNGFLLSWRDWYGLNKCESKVQFFQSLDSIGTQVESIVKKALCYSFPSSSSN